MKNNPNVRFKCKKEDLNAVKQPTSAHQLFVDKMNSNLHDDLLVEQSKSNVEIFDAMVHGWYFFFHQAVEINLDPDEHSTTHPKDYITKVKEFSSRGCIFTIETLWDVEFDDEYKLYITQPLYKETQSIIPQMYCDSSEPISIDIPVFIDDQFSVGPFEPIAQIIPLPSNLELSENNVGSIEENISEEFKLYQNLNQFYDNPYQDRIRNSKEHSSVVSEIE